MIEENISIQNEYNIYVQKEDSAQIAKKEMDNIAVPNFDTVGHISSEIADDLIALSTKRRNADETYKKQLEEYNEQKKYFLSLLKMLGGNCVILNNPITGKVDQVWLDNSKIKVYRE